MDCIVLGVTKSQTQLGDFHKTKYSLTIQSTNFPLWYSLRWVETYIHTKTCMQIFCSGFIHNCKKKKNLEVTRWVNCGTSCNGILFSNKKKSTKTWRKLKSTWLTERSHSEKATHCRIPANEILEKTKLWWCKKDQWLSGTWEEGEMERQNTGFLGNETILYGTLSIDTCHYTIVRFTE